MTDYEDQTHAAPPETSANDVHEWRRQDQTIADRAAQLDSIDRMPWSVVDMTFEHKAYLPSSVDLSVDSPCRTLSHMLSLASFPVAAAGSFDAVGGNASKYYVHVGNNTKVTCVSGERIKVLTDALNQQTWRQMSNHRAELLSALRGAVLGREEQVSKCRWSAYASSQCCMFFEHETHAKSVVDALNGIYQKLVDEDRAAIVAVMLAAIGPT